MMLATSSYSNIGAIPKNLMCVGISPSPPEWFADGPNTLRIEGGNILAPDEGDERRFRDGSMLWDDYARSYVSALSRNLHAAGFVGIAEWCGRVCSHFSSMGFAGVVFLCDEAAGEPCHRSILADILTRKGFPCGELPAAGMRTNAGESGCGTLF